jgi:hypothetical protein
VILRNGPTASRDYFDTLDNHFDGTKSQERLAIGDSIRYTSSVRNGTAAPLFDIFPGRTTIQIAK